MTVLDAFFATEGDIWVPFARGADLPPPAPLTANQVFGMTVPSSGPSFSSSVNQVGEEERLADLYGWDNGGPPVQRCFRQQQSAGSGWPEAQRVTNQGRVAWVSHKPASGGVVADRAGDNDAHWTGWGNFYKDRGPGHVWFTYDHETDRHTHSGGSTVTSAGWQAYQADAREAFVRIIGLMRAADTEGLPRVTFVLIHTGFAFRGSSNRDPGAAWHPDIDMVASDPYDFWVNNQGPYATRRQFYTLGSTSTGAREHYEWATNPVAWRDQYHPTWELPPIVAANLDKFPTRMAIGETGTQFDMAPNGSITAWVPNEDPESLDSYQASWLTQQAADIRTHLPRLEAICYWPSSSGSIGSSSGHPSYFHGPAANRWGAQWAGPIQAYRTEALKTVHRGAITPWSPSGLLQGA